MYRITKINRIEFYKYIEVNILIWIKIHLWSAVPRSDKQVFINRHKAWTRVRCLFSQNNEVMKNALRESKYRLVDYWKEETREQRLKILFLYRKGMDLYFKRHDGQAVTCDDFRAAMADANDADLSGLVRWQVQYHLIFMSTFFKGTIRSSSTSPFETLNK